MGTIYDSEKGWFIWSHRVDLCRKQCIPKQQYDWPYKAAFPKVSLKLWRQTALQGLQRLRILSIERLAAANVDAYWNYKVRH
jgi:hypothetical protein